MDVKRNSLARQLIKDKEFLHGSDADHLIAELFNTEESKKLIEQCPSYRSRIYTPIATLLAFIKQAMDSDKSCKRVVSRAVVENAVLKADQISSNTGPYCKARQRLLPSVIDDLVRLVSQVNAEKTAKAWKFDGRVCKVVDGTILSMADSKENRKVYSQHSNQVEGVGFPMIRMVALMSLSDGTVIDFAHAPHKGKLTGEHALFRQMHNSINVGDIILADSYYPSYSCITDIKALGADGLFRGMITRKYDFNKGECLGKDDHIVEWEKPRERPEWMDKATYDACPKKIRVREFKVDGQIYVTTLYDAKKYPKRRLANLYKKRWEVEINLRYIKDKNMMDMDKLRCKSPDMVRKEIAVHLLAYNIIRIIMSDACRKHGARPNKISFKGTVQLITEMSPCFLMARKNKKEQKRLYAELLKQIAKNKVGNRSGRIEPREVKRRGTSFPHLKRSRAEVKEKIFSARRLKTGIPAGSNA